MKRITVQIISNNSTAYPESYDVPDRTEFDSVKNMIMSIRDVKNVLFVSQKFL